MFRPYSLTVRGFRSFVGTHILTLPRRRGFYYMGGDNRVHPELGPNGVGKSTVWEAVVWCLTGKTSRGLKATNVASWQAEGGGVCSTQLAFKVSDNSEDAAVYVRRTWNPSTLTWIEEDGTEQQITQEQLEDRLGANFEILTATVLMSQFGRYFFDLTATEKLTLFSGLFDLEYWSGCADRARTALKTHETRAATATATLARSDGVLETLKKNRKETNLALNAWQEDRHKALLERRRDVERLREAMDRAKHEARKAQRQYDSWEAKKNDAQRELVRLDDQLRDVVRPAERAIGIRKEQIEKDIESLRREIDRIQRLGEGECPTCYGDVDRTRLRHVIRILRDKRLPKREHRLERCIAKHDRLKEELVTVTESRAGAEQKYKEAEREESRARRNMTDMRRIADDKGRGLVEAERRLENVRSQTNPYKVTLATCETDIGRAVQGAKEAKHALDSASKGVDRAGYWVGRFKDLRLWIIEGALVEFEVCVNNSLIDLGLHGWKITFDVERETKSGGVSKGFTVMIESPDSNGPVPWEVWSGGETQRLRIAGAVGLSDLVRARSGFVSALEVWDEPTAHLSREGVEDMLTFLQARAREQRKQIWLVDHVAMMGGEFDGAVTVVRGKKGSRFETGATMAKTKKEP